MEFTHQAELLSEMQISVLIVSKSKLSFTGDVMHMVVCCLFYEVFLEFILNKKKIHCLVYKIAVY